jgi:hypothetical protein
MVDEVIKQNTEIKEKVTLPDLSPVQKDLTTLKTNVDTTVDINTLKNKVEESSTDKTILKYIE